jgi:hypothetical protein
VVTLILGGVIGAVVLGLVLWRMRIPELADVAGMVRRG